MLSNCNRNSGGQLSGWICWLLASCTLCTYRDTEHWTLDKKRSSLIIILTQLKAIFWSVMIVLYMDCLSHYLHSTYAPYINWYLIYRHRKDCCITSMSFYCSIWFILLVGAHLNNVTNFWVNILFYRHLIWRFVQLNRNQSRILYISSIFSKEYNGSTLVL